jgi:hypothetical protein
VGVDVVADHATVLLNNGVDLPPFDAKMGWLSPNILLWNILRERVQRLTAQQHPPCPPPPYWLRNALGFQPKKHEVHQKMRLGSMDYAK